MLTLRESEVGKTYKVKKIHGEGSLKRRVMDMGITKNAELFIRKVAPLGDPVQISLRGYELTLRKEDSSLVEIEPID
ncbi:FeoA family protein [Peptostreptococcus sp. D1]|uniref:FeoA family protein n=1 Tax=Peptostreptococcus sp. D1 TaxID=72304 RepID=UPI0008EA3F38|nr:ferrous iron transport protein A [Peptostreptococcus sp. D1]SFE80022.1 ferrous iron transport protein A [Peptostreptococcus sp. D1]